MISFIKNLFSRRQLNYSELLERGAIIIDVRTPKEFKQGNVESSINIPLSSIENRIGEIKQKDKPVIMCCRSGVRSAKATAMLEKRGIEAYNAGSWNQVQAGISV